jgi:hypothetical protein
VQPDHGSVWSYPAWPKYYFSSCPFARDDVKEYIGRIYPTAGGQSKETKLVPRIRIILEDDQGNPLPDARRTYRLEGDLDTLGGIERAVQTFKERALPEVERSLLTEAQRRFVANARGGKSPPGSPAP